MCKEVARKEGDLMKPRGLAVVVLAILVVTALSAAGATAQNVPQQAQSGDVGMPTDVTGSGPTNITSDYETGNKQISTSQTAGPQPKQPREKRERNNKDDPTPTEAAPSSGNSTNPGGTSGSNGGSTGGKAGLSSSSGSALKELPRTGGPEIAGR
jgi:hypothetical protein